MSKEIDWSKAPEGAKGHGYVSRYDLPIWIGEDWYEHARDDGGRYFFSTAENRICAWDRDDVKNYVERPSKAWTGQGLPPVGVEVMISHKCNDQGTGYVVAYGQEMCLIRNTSRGKERDQCGSIEDYEFRPIRTPEQIAAEEREKAIQQMIEDADYDGKMVRGLFAKLHDAGYRKTEAGK